MGEPRPGDIVDPINLKTTQVALSTEQNIKRGDFVEGNDDDANYSAISTASHHFITGRTLQSQEDKDSTGFASGDISIAAFGTGSWIYARCGQALNPEIPVRLAVYDSPNGYVGYLHSLTVPINTSITGTADGVVTVVIGLNRGIIIGDRITVTNTTNYNFTYTVTGVSANGLTITMYSPDSTDTTAETSGNIEIAVTHATATAVLIKRSGDTVAGAVAEDDIAIFALGVAT